MIETTNLPGEYLSGETHYSFKPEARKRTITGLDEMQQLEVSPWTTINMHGHDDQWEVWIWIASRMAFVCLKGEEHELVNHSGRMLNIMAIKGHNDYNLDELTSFFKAYGYTVVHGSMKVED